MSIISVTVLFEQTSLLLSIVFTALSASLSAFYTKVRGKVAQRTCSLCTNIVVGTCTVLGICLVVATMPSTYTATQLARWTAEKDYLEWCEAELGDTLPELALVVCASWFVDGSSHAHYLLHTSA